MGAGNLHQGISLTLMHTQHIHPNQIAGGIALTGDLFRSTEDGIVLLVTLTQTDKYIAGGL